MILHPSPSAQRPRRAGFTLPELSVAIAASTLVLGSLLLAMMSLSRSFDATEKYARAHASQVRLIDSIAMDLRRATAISSTTSTTSNPAAAGNSSAKFSYGASNTQTIQDGTYDAVNNRIGGSTNPSTYLTLTIPGYYKSNDPAATDYRNVTTLISTGRAVRYGTSSGVAADSTVQYRKAYVGTYGTECFVRREEGVDRVLVEKAELINVSIIAQSDGTFVINDSVTPTFSNRRSQTTVREMSSDRVMLRNPRKD